MPGGVRELGNPADFPRVLTLLGSEVLPGITEDGAPIGIPTNVIIANANVIPALTEVKAGQTVALPTHVYANGVDGVGATITGAANGVLASSYFDSIALAAARVWVRLEGAKNGIFDVTSVGAAGAPFVLTRATDADTAAELTACNFSVREGATFQGRRYQCQQRVPNLIVGTTVLTFALLADESSFVEEVVAARFGEVDLATGIIVAIDTETDARIAADIVLTDTKLDKPDDELDARWSYKSVDPDGNIFHATGYDGSVLFGPTQTSMSIDGHYLLTAEDDGVIFGKDRFGVDLEVRDFDAWVDAGEAYLYTHGTVFQLTDVDADVLKAEVRGGMLVVVREDHKRIECRLSGRYPKQSGAIDTIEYSDSYGQSVAAGNASGAVVNGTAFSDRFMMYAAGQRAYGNILGHDQERTRPQYPVYDAIHDIVSGREQFVFSAGETPNSGFAWHALGGSGLAANVALHTTCSAIGSATQPMLSAAASELTDAINPMGQPWVNVRKKFERAALFWRLQGLDFITGPLRWNQGEGHINASASQIAAMIIEIGDDWQALAARWNALRPSGLRAGIAPLIATQTCSGAKNLNPLSDVPDGQLKVNVDDPDHYICAGPIYDQVYAADGAHPLSLGMEMQGLRQAVAYFYWLYTGDWYPISVSAAVRTATTVRLTLRNVLNLPLMFDTTTVTGLGGNQGFQWADTGGSGTTVTDADIISNTIVDLTLSGIPTGTSPRIHVAKNGASGASSGPTTGNRCTLRTSGSGVTSRTGRAVEHFASIQTVSVT